MTNCQWISPRSSRCFSLSVFITHWFPSFLCQRGNVEGSCSHHSLMPPWLVYPSYSTRYRYFQGVVAGMADRSKDVCRLPIDAGNCRALIHRWAHDQYHHKCIQFNWGGCGGNGNRFETEEECQKQCLKNNEQQEPHVTAGTTTSQ